MTIRNYETCDPIEQETHCCKGQLQTITVVLHMMMPIVITLPDVVCQMCVVL